MINSYFLPAAEAQVHRLFPSIRTTNRSHACQSEVLTLTCDVTGPFLKWTSKTAGEQQTNLPILFNSENEVGSGCHQSRSPTTALLLKNDRIPGRNQTFRRFTSVLFLNVSAVPNLPIIITCSSDMSMSNHTISVAGINMNIYYYYR